MSPSDLLQKSALALPCLLAAILPVAGHAAPADTAPTVADYERALALSNRYEQLVDVPEAPQWQENEHLFVYRHNAAGTFRFTVVDADTGQKRPAFDNVLLVAALNGAAHAEYKPDKLPFKQIDLADHGRAVVFQIDNQRWTCTVAAGYACTAKDLHPGDRGFSDGPRYTDTPEAGNDPDRKSVSPDGKWIAYIRNFNVMVKPAGADGKEVPLSWDGSAADYYAFSTLSWSPDSRHLAAYRIRPGYQHMVHFVNSSPSDQLEPKYETMTYPKPGDVLPLQQPVLFDVAAGKQRIVANTLFPNPYKLSDVKWWKDGRGFTFQYNQRGHQLFRVIEVDAATGRARTLVDEPSATFVDYRPLIQNQQDTGKIFRFDVDDGREIVWASERDGNEHLYLIDGRTGAVKRQITKGPWVVRAVNRVDPVKRQIWFEASGMEPGEDPYFVHGYRIGFDGTGLVRLTPAPANHRLAFSTDGQFYVDLSSRIDQGPRLELYSTADNRLVGTVEATDTTRLAAAGWQPPTPFHAKGRDGKTDIWGVIHMPANFDPGRHYPVIEKIYAGPQGSFVPKTFSTRMEPLTQIGFVVVQIDGMGTNNRSRAFHDVAWRNLADSGLPDRILWHKAAAAQFPWYDISNVGVFGTSAGGQNALAALEFHPEFYKAAVTNSGSYDNRMDKIWWNEQWMGWPVGPQYAASSTIEHADLIKGKLMIVVGEMDHNVDPSSAFQLMNHLIKSNKLFDTLYVPGADHGTPGPYAQLKLMDFFVRNIMGAPTPDWNAAVLQLPDPPRP